jgi:hypothetical protein
MIGTSVGRSDHPLALSGYPVPPPGSPVAAGGAPAPWCDEEADCSCETSPCCVPATLVGGSGVEDGRCALVGLRAAQ